MITINKNLIIIISFFILLILAVIGLLDCKNPFKNTGFYDERSASFLASKTIEKINGYPSINQIMLLFKSKKYKNTDPEFFIKIHKILKPLADDDLQIIYPEYNPDQVSTKNKHIAYAVLIYKNKTPIDDKFLKNLQNKIGRDRTIALYWGGESAFNQAVTQQTEQDLVRADAIAAPVALITLLLVFGSVVAAFMPLIMGGAAAVFTLLTLFFIGDLTELSIFTLNIAIMLGICLSLDYSLLIITRFREELATGLTPAEAIHNTRVSAGRSVVFSGAVVLASLSALFLFPMNILFSVAMGGTIAIFFAVIVAVILLPACLGIIGTNINKWQIRKLNYNDQQLSWVGHLVSWSVLRPRSVFLIITTLLVLLGLPLRDLNVGISDYKVFPKNSSGRAFYDLFNASFESQQLNPVSIVFSGKNIAAKGLKFQQKISNITGVQRAIIINKNKKNYVILQVETKKLTNNQLKNLLRKFKEIKLPKNANIGITGTKVAEIELLQDIKHTIPKALGWISFASFILLFVLLQSILLPIKAIFMNLLSLSACFGAIILVFQEGFGHKLLGFEPQGTIDVSLLIIIFCALFGFSMDYEVFLLSRIKEFYNKTLDTKQAVILGIDRSFRVITSAALIVIVICAVFLVAKIVLVKEFGLGIAVAVGVDAFIIRLWLVPATMAWLDKWNWYLPKFLIKGA